MPKTYLTKCRDFSKITHEIMCHFSLCPSIFNSPQYHCAINVYINFYVVLQY